jgi:hypothetical protein
MSNKVDIRIEQAARLRVSGMKDADVASKVGLTPAGLARILVLPEYLAEEQKVRQELKAKMDAALASKADVITEQVREECRNAVPLALSTLVEVVKQRKDLRLAMQAASELLDRDPSRSLAKATKAEGTNALPNLPKSVLTSMSTDGAKVLDSLKNTPAAPMPSSVTTPPDKRYDA